MNPSPNLEREPLMERAEFNPPLRWPTSLVGLNDRTDDKAPPASPPDLRETRPPASVYRVLVEWEGTELEIGRRSRPEDALMLLAWIVVKWGVLPVKVRHEKRTPASAGERGVSQ